MFSLFSSPDQVKIEILKMAISYRRERAANSVLESNSIDSVIQTANTFQDFVFKASGLPDTAANPIFSTLANKTQQNETTNSARQAIIDSLLDMGKFIEQETTNGNIATSTGEHLKELVSSTINVVNNG